MTRVRALTARLRAAFVFCLCCVAPLPAAAEDALDSGDTAWVLASTALVLFMTLPGLALFYGGLVRTKNVLSVLMQCLALTASITVLWLVVGYSLAFDSSGMQAGVTNLHSFIGGIGKVFLAGVDSSTLSGTIPEVLFFVFQMTFAIITPALIVGAFAERMKFSAMLLFSVLWLLFVYAPICHMSWGGDGGFFADMGVFDFAGGIVVHITAGVAALVAFASGGLCYLASTSMKQRIGYDDSLDVFGVHGVGGFIGTVLAGVFAAGVFGGNQGTWPSGASWACSCSRR